MFLLRPRELLLTVPSLPHTSDRTDDELDERATASPLYLLSSATERLFRPRVTSVTVTVKCVLFPQSVRFALSRRPTFGSRVLKRCDGLAAAGRFFEQGFAVRHERPGTRRHRRPSYGVVVSFIIRQQRSYVIILINPRAAIYVQHTEASVPDHRVCWVHGQVWERKKRPFFRNLPKTFGWCICSRFLLSGRPPHLEYVQFQIKCHIHPGVRIDVVSATVSVSPLHS